MLIFEFIRNLLTANTGRHHVKFGRKSTRQQHGATATGAGAYVGRRRYAFEAGALLAEPVPAPAEPEPAPAGDERLSTAETQVLTLRGEPLILDLRLPSRDITGEFELVGAPA